MRVAIVGCGLIGYKRARALGGCPLVAVADTQTARAQQLANQFPGCAAVSTWQEAVGRDDVDAVIVATTNDSLARVTRAST